MRLLFSKDNNSFQGLLFGVTKEEFCYESGDILDVAVNAGINEYGGERNISVRIRAIRVSGTDDSRLFEEMDLTDRFIKGQNVEPEALLPTREEVGKIYKSIALKPVLKDRIISLNQNSLGYAKTAVALMTLTQLNLVQLDENRILSLGSTRQKTELTNSPIYKNPIERRDGK